MSDDEEPGEVGAGEEVMSGEDALVNVSTALCQKIQEDEAFEAHMEDLSMDDFTSKLGELLAKVFADGWPEVGVSLSFLDECYDHFSGALSDAIEKAEGDSKLLAGLDLLNGDMADNEKLQAFVAGVAKAVTGEEAEGEEAEAGDAEKADGAQAGDDFSGVEINVNTLDELVLKEAACTSALDTWNLFVSSAESREVAGEAIYAALFESAPSLQSLFVTPRAVQAMRFMNGIASFVEALGDPPKLKILVETLGFGHMHLDVTPTRVVIFRDALLDLFNVELAERFNSTAKYAWTRLLNYVGGAIIFVKASYSGRVTCLLTSWKKVTHSEEEDDTAGMMGVSSDERGDGKDRGSGNQGDPKKAQKSFWQKMTSASNMDPTGASGGKEGSAMGEGSKGSNSLSAQNVPTTFPEMFKFNAAVMGFAGSLWMNEVLDCFNNIVTNVANSARLQEECDVLALRIAKVLGTNQVNLGEYKSCMLASLRSLLPEDWDSSHELAWTWMWDNVERLVLSIHGKPPLWEAGLGKFLGSLDEDQKFSIRKDIYSRFFTLAPAGQDFFKQSNTYLHVVADKIINMTLEIYQNPVKMVDDISALGLRHVGYAIPTVMFGPFVSASVEVLSTRTNESTVIESFRWSLGLVSKMLVRTITEGSTIVMKAINQNSRKLVKKAISCAPRGERANWQLIIQVGTQTISPLLWSVESGSFEAAETIIADLLTFRADRDRYYYAVDDLFKRHPDLIKTLCDQAPDLVPKLMDGLIWRSRLVENGMRRVNYYVKHLLIDEDGNLSNTLYWIAGKKDPKLACHPVCVLIADIVWLRVAFRSFMWGKSSILFTVAVFITSQSILEHLSDGENTEAERWAVFLCRLFIYVMSMLKLLYGHIRESYRAYKTKSLVYVKCIGIPKYLTQGQDAVSFCLMLALLVMCCLEPIWWCMQYQSVNGDKLFLETCPERAGMRQSYTIMSMLAMFFYYISLIDITVVSTRISGFTLVCVQLLSEVGLFLGALLGSILAFASAMSVLKQDDPDFAGIPKGAYALIRMALGAYDSTGYEHLRAEPMLLVMTFAFLITTTAFFWSMLIAQFNCAYSAVYDNMVGYARLQRLDTIVEIVNSVSKKRWNNFVESLRLNKRLEFNPGDVGVAGGIAMKEAANMHLTTTDQILRFGGSTSKEVAWPADEEDEEDDRVDKLEKLIQRSLQRITKTASGHGRGDSNTGTGTGTGTGSGSGGRSFEEGSGSDHDNQETI